MRPFIACFVLACSFAYALSPVHMQAAAGGQMASRAAFQVTAQGPSFEVAAIKPFDGAPNRMMFGCHGVDKPAAPSIPLGHCIFRNVTLKTLIYFAFGPRPFKAPDPDQTNELVIGGPRWINSDAFEVDAKSEIPDTSTQDQLFDMLPSLLVQRYSLAFHKENREISSLTLVVAKNGPKLTSPSQTPPFGLHMESPLFGPMISRRVSIDNLVAFLASRLGRPVANKTNLTGFYDFNLSWTPDESERNLGATINPPVDSTGPSLQVAIEQQLGLRLEMQTMTREVIVVDRAERPIQE